MTPEQFDTLLDGQTQTLAQQELLLSMLNAFSERLNEIEIRLRTLEAYIDRAQGQRVK